MSQLILNDNSLGEFEHYYMNGMQLLANIIDPNMLFAEVARAGGKTEGVTGPRLIRVANDMPGELSLFLKTQLLGSNLRGDEENHAEVSVGF